VCFVCQKTTVTWRASQQEINQCRKGIYIYIYIYIYICMYTKEMNLCMKGIYLSTYVCLYIFPLCLSVRSSVCRSVCLSLSYLHTSYIQIYIISSSCVCLSLSYIHTSYIQIYIISSSCVCLSAHLSVNMSVCPLHAYKQTCIHTCMRTYIQYGCGFLR
jgi:hypothetical protein